MLLFVFFMIQHHAPSKIKHILLRIRVCSESWLCDTASSKHGSISEVSLPGMWLVSFCGGSALLFAIDSLHQIHSSSYSALDQCILSHRQQGQRAVEQAKA